MLRGASPQTRRSMEDDFDDDAVGMPDDDLTAAWRSGIWRAKTAPTSSSISKAATRRVGRRAAAAPSPRPEGAEGARAAPKRRPPRPPPRRPRREESGEEGRPRKKRRRRRPAKKAAPKKAAKKAAKKAVAKEGVEEESREEKGWQEKARKEALARPVGCRGQMGVRHPSDTRLTPSPRARSHPAARSSRGNPHDSGYPTAGYAPTTFALCPDSIVNRREYLLASVEAGWGGLRSTFVCASTRPLRSNGPRVAAAQRIAARAKREGIRLADIRTGRWRFQTQSCGCPRRSVAWRNRPFVLCRRRLPARQPADQQPDNPDARTSNVDENRPRQQSRRGADSGFLTPYQAARVLRNRDPQRLPTATSSGSIPQPWRLTKRWSGSRAINRARRSRRSTSRTRRATRSTSARRAQSSAS